MQLVRLLPCRPGGQRHMACKAIERVARIGCVDQSIDDLLAYNSSLSLRGGAVRSGGEVNTHRSQRSRVAPDVPYDCGRGNRDCPKTHLHRHPQYRHQSPSPLLQRGKAPQSSTESGAPTNPHLERPCLQRTRRRRASGPTCSAAMADAPSSFTVMATGQIECAEASLESA